MLPGMEYQLRWSELLQNGDPSLGRRLSVGESNWDKSFLDKRLKNEKMKYIASRGNWASKRHVWWLHRHMKSFMCVVLLMGFLFLLDFLLSSLFNPSFFKNVTTQRKSYDPKGRITSYYGQDNNSVLYVRLLQMASASLAEREIEQKKSNFWKEQYPYASTWIPCADRRSRVDRAVTIRNHTGYILVSANGGLNQQRVAICNAVSVASLLNATLVIPRFLYSNVWKDPSQFSDIYQEETFFDVLKNDINIVKELPSNMKSIDMRTVGSLFTDSELSKEATPNEYIKKVLPVLLRNGVVHFLGFGNRLGFDALPSILQKLRCKCNFHALKFVPRIQKIGSSLVKRLRKYDGARSLLDQQLLGNFTAQVPPRSQDVMTTSAKYLALHLRFEVDMVAYSMCNYGGGDDEKRELQAYREKHFPLALQRLNKMKKLSPSELRMMGKCPLSPEEAALVLSGLGFNRDTRIYLAGSEIYGGSSRMQSIINLYPKLVTKEHLLTPEELEPLRNFSSQLAALDFIACAASNVFAMTDSGSQLSSLVSGFRVYYGGGKAPVLRPSKKRLAAILEESNTMRWHSFASRIGKMIQEGQSMHRNSGQSIYRHPRCRECMCKRV